MALPGQRGATNPENAAEVAELHALIVHLKLTHPTITWKQIGYATGYHWKYCQIVFYKERGKSSGAKLIEQHVVEVLEELEELADRFRPFVTHGVASGPPPSKDLLDVLLKVIARKARLSGASAWARRRALTSSAGGGGAQEGSGFRRQSAYSGELEARHRHVIDLRLNNPQMTWKEIGLITSFHPNTCSLIFSKAQEQVVTSKSLDGYRRRLLRELEEIGDRLRDVPPIDGAATSQSPNSDYVKALLRILDQMASFLGIDLVVPVDEVNEVGVGGQPDSESAQGAEAAFMREETKGQLYQAGILDIVTGEDHGARYAISDKGRATGFNFSPGWVERWKDVYVGYRRDHLEYLKEWFSKADERKRFFEGLIAEHEGRNDTT